MSDPARTHPLLVPDGVHGSDPILDDPAEALRYGNRAANTAGSQAVDVSYPQGDVMGRRPFSELRAQMSQTAQQRAMERTSALEEVVALQQQVAAITQQITSFATMLGWGNVPPQDVLERDLNALKARVQTADRLRALDAAAFLDERANFEAQVAALHQQNEKLESQLRELRTMGESGR